MISPPDCGSTAIQSDHLSPNGITAFTSSTSNTMMMLKAAIAREKRLKGWRRAKKVALIEKQNPRWEDLSEQWPQ